MKKSISSTSGRVALQVVILIAGLSLLTAPQAYARWGGGGGRGGGGGWGGHGGGGGGGGWGGQSSVEAAVVGAVIVVAADGEVAAEVAGAVIAEAVTALRAATSATPIATLPAANHRNLRRVLGRTPRHPPNSRTTTPTTLINKLKSSRTTTPTTLTSKLKSRLNTTKRTLFRRATKILKSTCSIKPIAPSTTMWAIPTTMAVAVEILIIAVATAGVIALATLPVQQHLAQWEALRPALSLAVDEPAAVIYHDYQQQPGPRSLLWRKRTYNIPAVGSTVPNLPPGAATTYANGGTFYYSNGTFYQASGAGYQIITAPIGADVYTLPSGAYSTTVNGSIFYVSGSTYYKPYFDGSQVAYTVSQA